MKDSTFAHAWEMRIDNHHNGYLGLLAHLYSVEDIINFTVKVEENDQIPLLDVLEFLHAHYANGNYVAVYMQQAIHMDK